MKKIKLDAEERTIMAAIEREEFVPLTGIKLREVADAVAARKKDKTLTMRRLFIKSPWRRKAPFYYHHT